MTLNTYAEEEANEHRCPRCDGQGWRWVVPIGFNPFKAGGWMTARVMRKTTCGLCDGAGQVPPFVSSRDAAP